MIRNKIGGFMLGHLKSTGLLERLRRLIGGNPPRIQVAALPWRISSDGQLEVLLITSRGTGRWVLPKGWIDGREVPSTAAAREAFEEAGIKGRISPHELGRYQYRKEHNQSVPLRCEVAVFPLEVTEEHEKWPEKAMRTKNWLSPGKAAALVKEQDLAELISTFRNPRKIAA